ncbi:MAG TPA: hypothetical protein DDW86_02865 [Clostridiales bacterium]|nr:hypothetical protein [Clostridiales bacterium]
MLQPREISLAFFLQSFPISVVPFSADILHNIFPFLIIYDLAILLCGIIAFFPKILAFVFLFDLLFDLSEFFALLWTNKSTFLC